MAFQFDCVANLDNLELRNSSVAKPSTSPLVHTSWHLSYDSSIFWICDFKEVTHLGDTLHWQWRLFRSCILSQMEIYSKKCLVYYWGSYEAAALSSYFVSSSRTNCRNLPALLMIESMNFFKVSFDCQARLAQRQNIITIPN